MHAFALEKSTPSARQTITTNNPSTCILCWKFHTTTTPNHHCDHQQAIDLRLCWKIYTTSAPNPHHQQPIDFFCVGKSTPPPHQTTTTSKPSTCVCVGKSTAPAHPREHAKPPPPIDSIMVWLFQHKCKSITYSYLMPHHAQRLARRPKL